jgi:hypothetical protein
MGNCQTKDNEKIVNLEIQRQISQNVEKLRERTFQKSVSHQKAQFGKANNFEN